MKEVFISYSTIDLVQAETVRNVLEKNGISCWMAPRDIPGGSNYTKEIPIAIRGCKVFVLILSENAQKSQWVLRELDSAVNNGKVILPFMLEDCALNDEFNFLLTGAQRYAAYQKKAEALEKLVSRVGAMLATEADGPQAPLAPENPAPRSGVKPVVISCPACNSVELTAKPKKLLRQSVLEYLTLLLCPAMSIVMFWVVSVIAVFIADELMLPAMLVGLVGGAVLGAWLANKIVKTSRLRKRKHVSCYRCNRCNKLFNYIEEL